MPRVHDNFYYSAAWRKVSKEVRAKFPICQDCGNKPSTQVDHHKPKHMVKNPFDRSNLRALCQGCHSRKTARYDGGLGNPVSSYRPEPGAFVNGKHSSPDHHWNKASLTVLPGPTALPLSVLKKSTTR